LQAEEEQKIEAEKAKEKAKKQEFLNRAAMFQQKKGPTEEEVRKQIQRESQKRIVSRKLNRALQEDSGKNPFALELSLKGKTHDQKSNYVNKVSDWEIVEDPGQRPYYWNRVTNETSYDAPVDQNHDRALPPPPPRMLPMANMTPLPIPERIEENADENENENDQTEQQISESAPGKWYYVCENEPNPYYWNIETNETSFEIPEGYDGAIYSTDAVGESATEEESFSSQIIWQEQVNEDGEYYYLNTSDGSVSYVKPIGQLYIAVVDEEGNEFNWQEINDGENLYYYNVTTGESVYEPPAGTTLIVQT
jgi:hypothetical protein